MKKVAILSVTILVICLLSTPVLAETGNPDSPNDIDVSSVMPGGAGDGAPDITDTYGTGSWIELNLPMTSLTPLMDGEWAHFVETSGWAFRSGGANTGTCTGVNLPSGARLAGITTWTNDTNATFNITYELARVDLVANTGTLLFTWTSSGTPGIERVFRALPGGDHTVLNDRATYALCIFHGTTGSSLQSAGATFWYHLQLSPAPATARFTDVPKTHIWFQYIEALAASGITTGCSPTQFCPDAPLTRGQMAVFLSRALGLHWPDL